MNYFIKRGEKTFGPHSLDQIRDLANAQKLTPGDLVSDNPQGPFQPIQNLLQQIQPANHAAAPQQFPASPSPEQQFATPVANPNQGVNTAFLHQTTYSKPKNSEPDKGGKDTKKILLIVGGSVGGVLSLVLIFVLFRTIFIMGNEIKEEKQAARAAAIARENSPEAKEKRRQFAQDLKDTITGQSNQNNSPNRTSSGNSAINQSRPTLSLDQIEKKLVEKLGANNLLDTYYHQLKEGYLKGKLKLADVPGALAQLEQYARKGSLDYKDAVAIAHLVKDIKFARDRGR